ncbi:hypothetical protein AVEN_270746-1 [Araneus ventricosus]|uniref:Uncharacterized protein n=1 Tax=Araneus ventricosus TaxID=182803 RepID=A0A4Y2T035_ARAVE|nr:hypothetical protein AVEN_270746-1 [Araneus ventricosus]
MLKVVALFLQCSRKSVKSPIQFSKMNSKSGVSASLRASWQNLFLVHIKCRFPFPLQEAKFSSASYLLPPNKRGSLPALSWVSAPRIPTPNTSSQMPVQHHLVQQKNSSASLNNFFSSYLKKRVVRPAE